MGVLMILWMLIILKFRDPRIFWIDLAMRIFQNYPKISNFTPDPGIQIFDLMIIKRLSNGHHDNHIHN